MIYISQDVIIKNWGVDNSETPLVSIKCTAYNQDKYISQTLDGFLIQKTTFPFEIIVHDDASTDNTAKIIKEYELKYPKIIKPIYETENQYSKPDKPLLKIVTSACKGKYIATCEGDDYWIDEYKLQYQINFLEKHPNFGACYTKALSYIQKNNSFGNVIGRNKSSFDDLILLGNCIPNLTTIVRKDLFSTYYDDIKPNTKNWLMEDYPQWLWFSYNSKIKFINKITSIYRILPESASHFNNSDKQKKFDQSILDIQNFFSTKYQKTYLLEQKNNYSIFLENWKKHNRIELLKISNKISQKNKSLKIKIFFAKNNLLFSIFLKLNNIKNIIKKQKIILKKFFNQKQP